MAGDRKVKKSSLSGVPEPTGLTLEQKKLAERKRAEEARREAVARVFNARRPVAPPPAEIPEPPAPEPAGLAALPKAPAAEVPGARRADRQSAKAAKKAQKDAGRGRVEGRRVKERRRGPVRRLAILIGALLLLAGIGLLGWFGWQYFGTNVVAKQAHERIIDEWDAGEGDAIGILRVDRFGEKFQVPIIAGFDQDALSRGVGWYEDGAQPGQIGNFVVAGHRVTHGEPFRDFLTLRTGDTVTVETRDLVYSYRIRNNGTDITVDFTQGWPLLPIPTSDVNVSQEPTEALITLLTCSELFHTDNRQVVIGELVETEERAG